MSVERKEYVEKLISDLNNIDWSILIANINFVPLSQLYQILHDHDYQSLWMTVDCFKNSLIQELSMWNFDEKEL